MDQEQISVLLNELETNPGSPVTNGSLAGFIRKIFSIGEAVVEAELQPAQLEAEKVPSAEVQTVGNQDVQELRSQLEALQKENEQLNNDCFSWQQAYDRLEQKEKEDLETFNNLEKQAASQEEQLQTARQQIALLTESGRQAAETAEKERRRLETQLTQELQHVQMTQADLAEAENAKRKLAVEVGELREEQHKLEKQVSEARERMSVMQDKLAAALVTKEEQEKLIESLQFQLESSSQLMGRLWPCCLNIPALQPFAERWKTELLSGSPSASLLFMFANIFTWSCTAAIDGRDDGDNSIEVMATTGLYNFSRFLLEWLYTHGETPDGAFNILCALADKLNVELANAGYEIEVPMLDAPFSSKSMAASAVGRNSGSVESVLAWGIKSSNSAIYKKKSIVTLN